MMIKGVIFDLDGTITRPTLDFVAIRKSLGLSPGGPVLEQILGLPPQDRDRKFRMLEEFETEAIGKSELNPGAAEILAYFRARGTPCAVCTRNSRKSASSVLKKLGLGFRWIRSRDDGPVKPSPEPVVSLAREMGLDVGGILVAGDFAFDTEAALSAGAFAVFLSNGSPPKVRTRYHYRIERIDGLRRVVEELDSSGARPGDRPVVSEEAGRPGVEG